MEAYKTKPEFWKSLKTGNLFSYHEFVNHGKGSIYRGLMDLPKGEYPYTLVYEEEKKLAWLR